METKNLLQSEIRRLNGGLLADILSAIESTRAAEAAERRERVLDWVVMTQNSVNNTISKHNLSAAEIEAATRRLPQLLEAAAAKKAARRAAR